MKGFRDFILRGNVVALAIAFVIGAAFTNVVQAFVKDFISPLIGIFFSGNFVDTAIFTINGSTFSYGDFINVAVYFLIVAAVLYYLVVMPMTRMEARTPRAETTKLCPECFNDIPIGARRCGHCTAVLEPSGAELAVNGQPGQLVGR